MPDESTPKPKPGAKPRAVTRKTKAEREEYARQEAERAHEKSTQEALKTPKSTATRGGRGGARGGRAGSSASKNERGSTTTSGVFSTSSGAKAGKVRAVDLGISEALDGDEPSVQGDAASSPVPIPTINNEVSKPTKKATGKTGQSGSKETAEEVIQFEDDPEAQNTRDIERIWISSEEEGEGIIDAKGKKKRRISRSQKPSVGLRPVRAARTLFEVTEDSKERIDPAIGKSLEDQGTVDLDTDGMDIDEQPPAITSTTKRDHPSSPELTRKSLKKPETISKIKDPKLLSETVEEKAERLRLNEDVERLKHSFVNKSDSDDSIDSKQEEAIFGRTDRDRMFLFQLPPLVPHLHDPITRQARLETMGTQATEGVLVKAEDASNVPVTNGDTSNTQDLTKDAPEAPPSAFTAESSISQRLPQGFVGKLKIHQSGKVTLDWGGTDMEVRYGTEVDFLQDVVRVEMPEEAEDDAIARAQGKAFAMGQVKKKMVLIPDWGRLYA